MKKRRSTVYVRPGKDVTLYVPVETPPEVIDYLNELKQEGTFSQGIIDILTDYVQRQGRPQRLASPASGQASSHHSPMNFSSTEVGALKTPRGSSASAATQSPVDPASSDSGLSSDNHLRTSSSSSSNDAGVDSRPSDQEQTSAKLNLSQIFKQAQRNSGKLTE